LSELALLGGEKALPELPRYNPIGPEEVEAAKRVVETGLLSGYLGVWDPGFYGGENVQKLEREWAQFFGVAHAVSVNSNTSGLMAALGAIGLEPGDEVIVSPWTMCASATSILVWNAIPVFADIEEETFNLDPESIEANITPHTRAIMVTDIIGHAADLDVIMDIARRHRLKVIEDAAQAPGALYTGGRYVGTVADIGVFSLNYHKHIHTGEGGICVTNDDTLAERMQLIRNHGEAVVEAKGVEDLTNMIGFNFRMTEIEAAIGIEQLKKLEDLVARKVDAADRLSRRLEPLPGLRTPVVKPDCTHVYYTYPLVYDASVTGVNRQRIVDALRAEGVPTGAGYLNLHLQPMFQKKQAYGRNGFPWSGGLYEGNVSYAKGICPVAERLHDSDFIGLGWCLFEGTGREVDAIAEAFEKIWCHLDDLQEADGGN